MRTLNDWDKCVCDMCVYLYIYMYKYIHDLYIYIHDIYKEIYIYISYGKWETLQEFYP